MTVSVAFLTASTSLSLSYRLTCPTDFANAVKLLVFLTLPADAQATNGIEQRRCTRRVLEAMLRCRQVVAVLFSHLAGPLERYESSKLRAKEDDGKVIQLFLTLIRNLLLASESDQERGENSASHQLKAGSQANTYFSGEPPLSYNFAARACRRTSYFYFKRFKSQIC